LRIIILKIPSIEQRGLIILSGKKSRWKYQTPWGCRNDREWYKDKPNFFIGNIVQTTEAKKALAS